MLEKTVKRQRNLSQVKNYFSYPSQTFRGEVVRVVREYPKVSILWSSEVKIRFSFTNFCNAFVFWNFVEAEIFSLLSRIYFFNKWQYRKPSANSSFGPQYCCSRHFSCFNSRALRCYLLWRHQPRLTLSSPSFFDLSQSRGGILPPSITFLALIGT